MELGNIKLLLVRSDWDIKDYTGAIAMRLGIGRFSYKIPPGLYGLGNPSDGDPIFITANYKYTFDILRKDLKGIDCYILVINTEGINVWCAAGKGTFSTREIIYRISKMGIKKNLKKSKIILPQLGAPSVEPHVIKKMIGVSVIYGPIRSSDIKEFLKNDMKATSEMRKVTFSFYERMILTPLEFISGMKICIVLGAFIALLLAFKGLLRGQDFWNIMIPSLIGITSGSVVFPAVIPFIPLKSFSAGGGILGAIGLSIYWLISGKSIYLGSAFFTAGYFILLIVIASYISFNFTGCTSFTSPSGVKHEAKYFKIFSRILALVSLALMGFGIGGI